MTELQKQHLLAYLGFYQVKVDGIWGPASREATVQFQQAYMESADGIFGPATERRIREVIAAGDEPAKGEDMTPDEEDMIPDEEDMLPDEQEATGTFWDEIEFFDREEFRCQCGGRYCNGFPVEPQEDMVRTVNEIRRRLGVPVEIVTAGGSGVRCPAHNAAVGGVANSNHLYGNAADLHSKKSPQEMARVAENVMGNTGEIGIYSWGIHVGVNCKYSRFYG